MTDSDIQRIELHLNSAGHALILTLRRAVVIGCHDPILRGLWEQAAGHVGAALDVISPLEPETQLAVYEARQGAPTVEEVESWAQLGDKR